MIMNEDILEVFEIQSIGEKKIHLIGRDDIGTYIQVATIGYHSKFFSTTHKDEDHVDNHRNYSWTLFS